MHSTVRVVSVVDDDGGQECGGAQRIAQWSHEVSDERLLQAGKLRLATVHVRRDGKAQ